MLIQERDMISLAIRSDRSYIPSVALDKRFGKLASTVVYAWVNTSVEHANFFDDDTSKEQYHCNGCGICRIGGRENFFHHYKCRCCYSVLLKNGHPCVEGAMHHDCPVCFEYLFDSTNDVIVMPCGTNHSQKLFEGDEGTLTRLLPSLLQVSL